MNRASHRQWGGTEVSQGDRLYPLEKFQAQDRAKIVEEYLSNKKQAAEYKSRGLSHVFGVEERVKSKASVVTAKGIGLQATVRDNLQAEPRVEEKIQSNVQAEEHALKPTAKDNVKAVLRKIKKKDISEVKAFGSPPVGVKIAVEAVMIILGIKPERRRENESGRMVDDYWISGKKFLADPNKFLEVLQNVDMDTIPAQRMDKIRSEYITRREFNPEALMKVSTACAGLCKWVLALEAYDRMKVKDSVVTSSEILKTTTADKVYVEPKIEQKVLKDIPVVGLETTKEKENDLFKNIKISKGDITEMKSLAKPPAAVIMVVEALVIIFGMQPKRIQDKTGKMVNDYWAAGKKLLSDPKLLDKLQNVHKINIPAEVMEKIRSQYIQNEDFTPEKIKNVSCAAAGLCKLVIALERRHRASQRQ